MENIFSISFKNGQYLRDLGFEESYKMSNFLQVNQSPFNQYYVLKVSILTGQMSLYCVLIYFAVFNVAMVRELFALVGLIKDVIRAKPFQITKTIASDAALKCSSKCIAASPMNPPTGPTYDPGMTKAEKTAFLIIYKFKYLRSNCVQISQEFCLKYVSIMKIL